MPMEQETLGMLNAGFLVVMGAAFIVVILLFFSKSQKRNRTAYGLVFVHFVFLSFAIHNALKAISFDTGHPMASEEISLRLGIAGVLWAVAMLFLLSALFSFSYKREEKNVQIPIQ
ncbi:hypothetical protein [Bacillus marinisedimentorum]|uniref:hypothetical protein n=1 Tax=Bacillus marinisedimentorum TaxID=1821260 RepID=UPI0007E285D6|nr:hypothetical protein [Bacillus marinisedimentorum]